MQILILRLRKILFLRKKLFLLLVEGGLLIDFVVEILDGNFGTRDVPIETIVVSHTLSL